MTKIFHKETKSIIFHFSKYLLYTYPILIYKHFLRGVTVTWNINQETTILRSAINCFKEKLSCQVYCVPLLRYSLGNSCRIGRFCRFWIHMLIVPELTKRCMTLRYSANNMTCTILLVLRKVCHTDFVLI